MKKLALTSLLAFFVAGGAYAANIIDGNPLYRPDAGHFYSVSALESHSEATENWRVKEEFAYGVTDELAVFVKTGLSEKESFDYMSWDDLTVGLNYRVLDTGAWRADVYGMYGLDTVWGDHAEILDELTTDYTWTLGLRAGYLGQGWTLAGHLDFDYVNSESFNWGDDGVHSLSLGIDGQLVVCPKMNLVAGVEYTGMLDDVFENAGKWTGKLGANYNLDETKYVGAYVMGEMEHSTGDWEFVDGFGFGFTFGIDF